MVHRKARSWVLFLLYINPLVEQIRTVGHVDPILFADDITVVAEGRTAAECANTTQQAVDLIMAWCDANGMPLAPAKTQALLFTPSNNSDETNPGNGGIGTRPDLPSNDRGLQAPGHPAGPLPLLRPPPFHDSRSRFATPAVAPSCDDSDGSFDAFPPYIRQGAHRVTLVLRHRRMGRPDLHVTSTPSWSAPSGKWHGQSRD